MKTEENEKIVDFRFRFDMNIPRWYPYVRIIVALRNYCVDNNLSLDIDDCGGFLRKTYFIKITGKCSLRKARGYEHDIKCWLSKLENL